MRFLRATLICAALCTSAAAETTPTGDEARAATEEESASEPNQVPPDSGEMFDIEQGETVEVRVDDAPVQFGHQRIDAAEAEETPGAGGDALKALQNQAGVQRPPLGSEGISLWGAAPGESALLVDDIPVPRMFHLGGYRSILPSRSINRFDLMPAAPSSRFGRSVGGVVDVRTKIESTENPAMRLRVDPIDMGAEISVPISQRTQVAMGGRLSLLEQSFTAAAPARSQEIVPIPSFWDSNLRFEHELSDTHRVRVTALGAGDQLDRQFFSLLDDQSFQESTDESFIRLGATFEQTLKKSQSRTTLYYGQGQDRRRFDFQSTSASDDRSERFVGVLIYKSRQPTSWLSLNCGLDGTLTRTHISRSGALTLPPREGDVFVSGQGPGNRVNEDAWTLIAGSVALFSDLSVRVTSALNLTAGMRIEPSVQNGNRVLPVRPTEPEVGTSQIDLMLGPRLRFDLALGSSASLFGALGRMQQRADPSDASPVFGNPRLGPKSTWQAYAGFHVGLGSALDLSALAYASLQRQLPARNGSPTPPQAQLIVSEGEGRNTGAQFELRTTPGRDFKISLSYALSRAERRNSDAFDWRLYDQDITHLARASAGWSNGKGLTLGALVEVSSGFPRTSVSNALFDSRSQTYDPVFGGQNQARLPMFLQLSARASYEGSGYKIWLDVVNASNRQNVLDWYYSSDYSARDSVFALPIFPMLGAEIEIQ